GAQPTREGGHEVEGDPGRCGDAHHPARSPVTAQRGPFEFTGPFGHSLRRYEQPLPFVGERGPARRAPKKTIAKSVLELGQPSADCGLPNGEAPRGAAQAPCFGDGEEKSYVVPGDIHFRMAP